MSINGNLPQSLLDAATRITVGGKTVKLLRITEHPNLLMNELPYTQLHKAFPMDYLAVTLPGEDPDNPMVIYASEAIVFPDKPVVHIKDIKTSDEHDGMTDDDYISLVYGDTAFIEELTKEIVAKSKDLVAYSVEATDEIADYMCNNVNDYDHFLGLLHQSDGKLVIIYADNKKQTKIHELPIR